MDYIKNILFRKLREMIIFDYIISLRPFGEKIKDFFFMFLNNDVFYVINMEIKI